MYKDTPKKKFEKPIRQSWRTMSEEEKDEIKENAEKKRLELEKKRLQKEADILSGKQMTIDKAWE